MEEVVGVRKEILASLFIANEAFKIAVRTDGLSEAQAAEVDTMTPCGLATNCLLCCRSNAERGLTVPGVA